MKRKTAILLGVFSFLSLIEIYKEFQDNINSVYELLFSKLDDLFYGLL